MEKHPTAFDERDVYALHFTLERHGTIHVKGRVQINDIITVSFDDVTADYMVHNPDGSTEWTSVDKDRNTAILRYLQRRLGIGIDNGQ